MAGIKDIAMQCGVTSATVSLALRNHPRISESRRIEIHAVAERLGYSPNVIARSLRGGKTNSIGILWSLAGPHNSLGLIRSMTKKFMNGGYVSYVADSLSDSLIIKNCLKDYVIRNIDGLVLQVPENFSYDAEIIELLKGISCKIIINDCWHNQMGPLPDCDVINRDRLPAWKDIIEHFKKSGRRKIGLIIKERHLKDRARTFLEYMKLYGLPDENSVVVDACLESTNISSETRAMLLSGNIPYDAIITFTDENAAAVISTLIKNGTRVPEDIAVVGFNDSTMSRFFLPPIATVDRRDAELATLATEMLTERLENPALPYRSKYIAMEFVHRTSAG